MHETSKSYLVTCLPQDTQLHICESVHVYAQHVQCLLDQTCVPSALPQTSCMPNRVLLPSWGLPTGSSSWLGLKQLRHVRVSTVSNSLEKPVKLGSNLCNQCHRRIERLQAAPGIDSCFRRDK